MIRVRGGLGLGGGDGQPHARGPKIRQQRGDALEDAVHRPATGRVVGAIGGDRLVGPIAEPHGLQREVHRWPDDAAREVAVGNRAPRSRPEHDGSSTRSPSAESVSVPSRSKITSWALTPPLSPMCRVVPVPGPGLCALVSSCGEGNPMSVRVRDVIEVLDDGVPTTARPCVGLRRPGLRRPVGAGRVGDGGRRRHRRSRRRRGRGRTVAGPPPVAAARSRHRGRRHGEGGAAARAHPPQRCPVHRPHERRRGFTRGVRRAGRGPRPDRRGRARTGRRAEPPRQVGDLRPGRERRSRARGRLRRRRRPHRRLLALQLDESRARASSCRSTARRRPSAASAPSSG